MEKLQLIQATLVRSNAGADKLLYLVRVDVARVQQLQGEADEQAALATAIRNVQSAITSAFPSFILVWESPVELEMALPDYDPLYKMDGVSVWIMPVVSKNEAYFYLVG